MNVSDSERGAAGFRGRPQASVFDPLRFDGSERLLVWATAVSRCSCVRGPTTACWRTVPFEDKTCCYRRSVNEIDQSGGAQAGNMPLPFEIALPRSPVSQQARRSELRVAWQEEVRNAARQRWRGTAPTDGLVALTITYFFDAGSPDVDNIPKPILDALKGLVYADDDQVIDLACRKRDLREDVVVRNPSPY